MQQMKMLVKMQDYEIAITLRKRGSNEDARNAAIQWAESAKHGDNKQPFSHSTTSHPQD